MPSKKITTAIEPGAIYHIYNRGNNYQKVFFRESDYTLFLEKFKHYMLKVCSLYAFVLIPNHYHLLLRVNDNIEGIMFSNQFSKFMLSYTNFINRRDRRNGSLFLCRFRRIKIENDNYLRRLVFYINHNAVKHKITEDYRNYRYSSYQILTFDNPTKLSRDEVLSWFDGKAGFIEFHAVLHGHDSNSKYNLE